MPIPDLYLLSAEQKAELDATLEAASEGAARLVSATTQALGVAGISAQYVSNTTADPPAAPDGTRGARRDAHGNLVLLARTAGAWAPDALALASIGTVTGLAPDPDAGLRPITPADLAPGTPILQQRFVLLDRPRTLGALPGLGGVPMAVWDWEFQPMPWLTERELGAGELYVRAQVFGFTSGTYPLRVRVLNTTFSQSADIVLADVPDDENSGGGSYRWKRSAWLPIRDVTLLGRRTTPTLQCQILAPNGAVEIWHLALEFAWRR